MARYAKFFSLGAGGGGTNNLQLPVGTILDATLRQVQDGLGTGSPLYLSTRRVGITSDSSVTTQTSSVIQATTTNANLVIAPNGTGALIASIPDGTVTGGNARGNNAVDLQIARANANQVAAGDYSVALGTNNRTASPYTVAIGNGNTTTGYFAVAIGNGCTTSDTNAICMGTSNSSGAEYGVVSGGRSNIGNAVYSVIGGGLSNNQGSQYGTISGGQSNTASTGTHATVVGGQGNTSSGQYSISGGLSNTASGYGSMAIGGQGSCIASGYGAVSIGGGNAGGTRSIALGPDSTTTGGDRSIAFVGGQVENGSSGSAAFGQTKTTSVGGFSFGNDALSYLRNQFAQSPINIYGGNTVYLGYSQASQVVAVRQATLTTGGTTILSLDGTGTTNLIIPTGTNRMWNVTIKFVAVVTTITGTATGVTVGDTKSQNIEIGFKKVGGVSSLVGGGSYSISQEDASMNSASLVATAGASQQLQLTFTAPTFVGGGSVTCRVVAKVELVEVAY
jgi:hypothetical protein